MKSSKRIVELRKSRRSSGSREGCWRLPEDFGGYEGKEKAIKQHNKHEH